MEIRHGFAWDLIWRIPVGFVGGAILLLAVVAFFAALVNFEEVPLRGCLE